MSHRLKDIWAGFEAATTRSLTGRGVDNINVPHRVDFAAEDEAFLPENFNAPAAAAFAALRERLEQQNKKFTRKNRRRAGAEAAGDPTPMASQSFDGEELIRGLKATALRTERPERDYGAFLSSDAGRAVLKKHKRKKRFGLF